LAAATEALQALLFGFTKGDFALDFEKVGWESYTSWKGYQFGKFNRSWNLLCSERIVSAQESFDLSP